MADPLSALSLAANITQFAEFAIKVVKEIRQLHNSEDDAHTSNLPYENLARDIAENDNRIREALIPFDAGTSSDAQGKKLKRVADDCKKAATDLSNFLTKLKANEESGKWETLCAAVKNVWNKERIDEELKKLVQVRQNAESEILLNVSEKIDAVLNQQAEMSTHLDHSTNDIFKALRDNRKFTQNVLVGNTEAIEKLHRFVDNAVRSGFQDAKEEIIGAVQMLDWATASANWDTANVYRASLPGVEESIKADFQSKEKFKAHVRAALMFQSMSERLEEISEAHRRTFQWVYDPPDPSIPWDSFSDWLQSESGIYWIQGKPGSGKSCLMKYLYDEEKTGALLETWSEGLPIVKAGFFFWYAGTDLQKSQDGLLRSILFQILEQQPRLIPIAYPSQWSYYRARFGLNKQQMKQPITNSRTELANAIVRITTQTKYPLKMCLIIDGLDEYNGDHAEVIEIFKKVASTPSTKLCISSRQWPVFVEAFGSCPGLVLQDLTRDDIQRYVSERLGESPGMMKLQLSEPEEAPLLIKKIVERSAGVFLWVRIVVTSLLAGLTNNDRIVDLQERLRELPEELEELYIYILKRIDPIYLKQALRLVRIVQHSRRPLSSLIVSIADEFDVEGIVDCNPTKLPNEEVASRCQTIEDKIQSRCLGLLECHQQILDPNYVNNGSCLENILFYCRYSTPVRRVQFMHRTVKDFFDLTDINEEFQESLGGIPFKFDVHSTLALTQLAQLKRLFTVSQYGAWASAYPTFWGLIKECFYHAAECDRLEEQFPVIILDDLERTAQYHYGATREAQSSTWSLTWVHTHSSFQSTPENYRRRAMFLALILKQTQLEYYPIYHIENIDCRYSPLRQPEVDFLLAATIWMKTPNRRICQTVLNAYANPNAGDPSSWQRLLEDSRWRLKHGRGDVYQNDNAILEQFIYHGADLQTHVPIRNEKNDAIPGMAPVILLHRGSPRLVFMMLDRGVDPMQEFPRTGLSPVGNTLWREALRHVYQDLVPVLETNARRVDLKCWIEIYKLLLEYGASPLQVATATQRIGPKSQSRIISVLAVIREVFSKWEPEAAESLLAQLPKDTASNLRNNAHSSSADATPSTSLLSVPRKLSSSRPVSLPASFGNSVEDQLCTSPTTKQTKRISFTGFLAKLKI